MKNSKGFLSLFSVEKPIVGVIHLKGKTNTEILERAKREIEIYMENGLDAILIENYYGNYYHMEMALEYLIDWNKGVKFGVNCLNFDVLGFELARKYQADFIQMDSVVGHLKPRDDVSMEVFLKKYRQNCSAYVLGGVRFKYQPYLSGRSLTEDLMIAMERCEAIVVTQDRTGQETSIEKIKEFRQIIGNFPLIVGAGVTRGNIASQMEYADGFIIGSYFKDNYKDNGDVCAAHVKELVEEANQHRKKKGVKE